MTSTPPVFTVTAVQHAPVFLDKDATIDKACDLIAEAAAAGASLAVFPEAFVSAYPDWVWVLPAGRKAEITELYRELLDNAVTIPDASIDRLCKAAKQAGIHVTIGVNERNAEASDASLYNTLVYIGPDGSLLGKHRKLIPTGGERLMWSQGGGDTLVSFNTPLGKLGGLLCWENYMPMARQVMYNAGVQVYVAPTWDSSESWHTAMRHLAREGGMFVIGCAPCVRTDDIPDRYEFKKNYPEDREFVNKGNSCIVDPGGNVLAGPAEGTQEILYAEIDLAAISTYKWLFDAAGHYARPDVFDLRVKG